MRTATRPRPPRAVIAATALAALAVVSLLIVSSELLSRGDAMALLPLAILALWVLEIIGLWRGSRIALVIAVLVAGSNVLTAINAMSTSDVLLPMLQIVYGVSLLLLLLVPAQARNYFFSAEDRSCQIR
jgi:hypothetical protein